MARPISIPIKQRGKRWQITVAESISPTGKLWRPSYPTRREAEAVRAGVLAKHRQFGVQSADIRPALAEDALRAAELLADYEGVTLTESARYYVMRRKERESSVTVAALWAEYLETKIGISDSYEKDLERYSAKVIPKIGSRMVCDCEPVEIEKAIAAAYKTPTGFNNTYRALRPAWTLAVKRGYCAAHPFDRIDQLKKTAKPIEVLTVAQVNEVLKAAQTDFTKRKDMLPSYQIDCTECFPAVALMVFAGIRPKEIQRLEWADIQFDHECIRVSGAASKTRSSRIIPMADNLRAWLEAVPKEKRTGRVISSRWGKSIQAVRHAAGISELQDVLRHTYASYHLAAHADMKGLQEGMGHSTPEMILKHYRALVSKSDAVKFWSIRPNSKEPQIKDISA